MKTIEMMKSENRISLIMILKDNETLHEYVIASNYDKTKPFGEQWTSGRYTSDLQNALDIFYCLNDKISKSRLEELSSHALHYLKENEMLEEFLYNYDLELEETETKYFEL